jgi:cell division protein FtsQ
MKQMVNKEQIRGAGWIFALLLGVFVVLSAVQHRGRSEVKAVEVDIEPLPSGAMLIRPVDVKELIERSFGYQFEGRPLRMIELERLERVLEKDPLVLDADVYFDARSVVRVGLVQREPILRVIDKHGLNYYLDKDGNQMPLSKHFTARVLVATGHIPPHVPDFLERKKHVLRNLFDLSRIIRNDEFLHPLIGQVYVSSNGDFILTPVVGDQKIIFGKHEETEDKIQNLKIFYREALPYEGWRKYRYIDVRYRGQVVAK